VSLDQPMTLISAHRGGVGQNVDLENTREALETANSLACEFVEFDVQRLGDGALVLYHDDKLVCDGVEQALESFDKARFEELAPNHLGFEDALKILAGRKRAHIDFKFRSPPELRVNPDECWEVGAAQVAIDILGDNNLIITTLEDDSVTVMRNWARHRYPWLLVGLSLGRKVSNLSRPQAVRIRLSELFPARRIRRCDANLIVAQKRLARIALARFARRRKLPLLVWTVDENEELDYWLRNNRAWLVTTNFPDVAAALRNDSRHAQT